MCRGFHEKTTLDTPCGSTGLVTWRIRQPEVNKHGREKIVKGKRIGLIVPSANTTIEQDFHKLAPAGVTIHSTRMWATAATPDILQKMNEEVEQCARYLATARVDIIVYSCTSGSFFGGPEYDQKLLNQIREAAGIPAVATTTAVLEALKKCNIWKLAIATPYSDELNERLRVFFEAHRFQIISLESQDIKTTLERGDQTPEDVYQMARKAFRSEADGIFLSCTNWGGALEAVERVERDLNKPTVTSNQATIWATLRAIGIKQPIQGYGRLLFNLSH